MVYFDAYRERERGYNKVQACFLVETFYSEFSSLRASSIRSKTFPLKKTCLDFFYTFSTWHHTKSFLHGAVHRSRREPFLSIYIYIYIHLNPSLNVHRHCQAAERVVPSAWATQRQSGCESPRVLMAAQFGVQYTGIRRHASPRLSSRFRCLWLGLSSYTL